MKTRPKTAPKTLSHPPGQSSEWYTKYKEIARALAPQHCIATVPLKCGGLRVFRYVIIKTEGRVIEYGGKNHE